MSSAPSYERGAVLRADEAAAALRFALMAFGLAGFGAQLTKPLRSDRAALLQGLGAVLVEVEGAIAILRRDRP